MKGRKTRLQKVTVVHNLTFLTSLELSSPIVVTFVVQVHQIHEAYLSPLLLQVRTYHEQDVCRTDYSVALRRSLDISKEENMPSLKTELSLKWKLSYLPALPPSNERQAPCKADDRLHTTPK